MLYPISLDQWRVHKVDEVCWDRVDVRERRDQYAMNEE